METLLDYRPFSLLLTGTPGWLCDTVLGKLGEMLPALTRVRCLVQPGISEEKLNAWRRLQPTVTEVVFGDLRDVESLAAACENMRGGVVLHAAALRHPKLLEDWFTVNRDGTLALAQCARDAGAKRFIYISSLAAQGESSHNAALDEDMPCDPFSTYGRSRLEAEEGLLKLHDPGKFEVVILRPSEFYGTPVPPPYVKLFKDIRAGRDELIARGRITCSLSHVDDLAVGVITAMIHPRAAGEIFNLCDAHNYSQLEIHRAIADALNVPLRFKNIWPVRCDIAYVRDRMWQRYFKRYKRALHLFGEAHRHTGASSRKAQHILGLAPRAQMSESFKKMVDWAIDQNLM